MILIGSSVAILWYFAFFANLLATILFIRNLVAGVYD
jgi:hypothetical protein